MRFGDVVEAGLEIMVLVEECTDKALRLDDGYDEGWPPYVHIGYVLSDDGDASLLYPVHGTAWFDDSFEVIDRVPGL